MNWIKRLFKKPESYQNFIGKYSNQVRYKISKKVYRTSSYLKEEARKYISSVFPFMCEYCGTGYKNCPEFNCCIMCGAPGIIENEK